MMRERTGGASPGLRKIFALFWWEGAFAMAYETWVGQTYLSALAGAIHVPVSLVSILVAAPSIGLVGQVVGVWALEQGGSLRTYTLRVAALARALWILPVFLAAFWGVGAWKGARSFPLLLWFAVLTGVAGVSSLLGASSGAAWMSWVRGWVPEGFRGRFFGVRQRYVMLTLILANLIASVCTSFESRRVLGYFLLGCLALVAAGLSSFLLAKIPDAPVLSEEQQVVKKGAWLDSVLEPFRNPEFRKVLLLGAGFYGALQLAGPYFPYFFTRRLGLSMSHVAGWIAISSLGCFVFAGFWGRKVDRTRDLRAVLGGTALVLALSPIPYALMPVSGLRWFGPLEYFVNGAAWVGYTIALTTALLRVCPPARGAIYFSVYAASTGVTGAMANFLGARLAGFFSQWDVWGEGFRALFLLTAGLRVGVAALFYRYAVSRRKVVVRAEAQVEMG